MAASACELVFAGYDDVSEGGANKRDTALPLYRSMGLALPRLLPSSPLGSQPGSPVYLHTSTPTATMADEKKLSDYVTLVSNDGYEFKILRSAACIAGTIKKALDPTCSSLPFASLEDQNC